MALPTAGSTRRWRGCCCRCSSSSRSRFTLGGDRRCSCCRARHGEQDADAPDVRAAAAAAEAVMLIALIWVAFQGYAAVALVDMWTAGTGGLGGGTTTSSSSVSCSRAIVAIRAHVRLGRPAPRPFVADHWRFGQLYKNADDPALFVPTRDGCALDAQLRPARRGGPARRRPAIGILGPTIILVLALQVRLATNRINRYPRSHYAALHLVHVWNISAGPGCSHTASRGRPMRDDNESCQTERRTRCC